MKSQTLGQWIDEGPFTLALSSSFFGFYAHCGIVTALSRQGVRPAKITGASAGALIGAAWSSGLDFEFMRDLLFSVERQHFWDPALGFGYLRGRKFLDFVRQHFKPTFTEAHIPLGLAVLDLLTWRTVFLDQGALPEAVVASCAVPFMFHPVRIGRRLYVDGGVFRKSGMQHEARDERILCIFIESDGMAGAYERRITFDRMSPRHRIVRLKNLPEVNPLRLQLGREAYREALTRTESVLTRAFEGDSQILDA